MKEIECSECATVFHSRPVEFLDSTVVSELPETCLYCRKNVLEAKRAREDSSYEPAFVLTPAILENCVDIRSLEEVDL